MINKRRDDFNQVSSDFLNNLASGCVGTSYVSTRSRWGLEFRKSDNKKRVRLEILNFMSDTEIKSVWLSSHVY